MRLCATLRSASRTRGQRRRSERMRPTNFLSDAAAAVGIAVINSIGNLAGIADLVEADSVRHDVTPLDFFESLMASTKHRERAQPAGSRLTQPVFLVPGWVNLKGDHQRLLPDLVDSQIAVTRSNRVGRATSPEKCCRVASRSVRPYAAASTGCAGRRPIISDRTAATMPVAPAIMKACR